MYESILTAVLDNARFTEQIKRGQLNDDIISEAKEIDLGNGRVKRGRLKRVQNQRRIENDILTNAGRPIIPPPLRMYVLKTIHNIAHFGIDKTYAMLQDRFYWPSMLKLS